MTNENLKTWPEQIYLQVGDDGEDFPTYGSTDLGHVTWCQDSITEHEVKYIRADLLDQANTTIAELRKKLLATELDVQMWQGQVAQREIEVENLKKEKKWSHENAAQAAALQAEMEKLRAEAEGPSINYQQYITNLENKILGLNNEVESLKKRKKSSYEDAAQAAALRAEMEKLRAAVPGDVDKAIYEYGRIMLQAAFWNEHNQNELFAKRDAAKNNISALIGALIERSREERKMDIIAAYKAGWDESFGKPEDKSEEYAERILEGK